MSPSEGLKTSESLTRGMHGFEMHDLAGEPAQLLRALAVFAEDSGSVPSIRMEARNHSTSSR